MQQLVRRMIGRGIEGWTKMCGMLRRSVNGPTAMRKSEPSQARMLTRRRLTGDRFHGTQIRPTTTMNNPSRTINFAYYDVQKISSSIWDNNFFRSHF